MKRKSSRGLFLLILLLLVVGCRAPQTTPTAPTVGPSNPTGAQNPTTPQAPETAASQTASATTESETERASSDADVPTPIAVSFAEEKPDVSPAVTFVADETDPQVAVLLQSEAVLKEVEILKFRYEEGQQGMMVFPEVMTTIDELSPNHPLLVKMTFYGLYPIYGISYPDVRGVRQYFAVDMSGEDGSLYLLPIEPTTNK